MRTVATGTSERDDAGLQIALSLSIFLAALNFFALSPFTPRIAADLHTSVPLVGQISTLMILTSALLGLVIGPVSDHIGTGCRCCWGSSVWPRT